MNELFHIVIDFPSFVLGFGVGGGIFTILSLVMINKFIIKYTKRQNSDEQILNKMQIYGIKDKCCTINNLIQSEDPKYYCCKTCNRVFTIGNEIRNRHGVKHE